jgi:hypothetical protein
MNKLWKKIKLEYDDLNIEKYDYDLDSDIVSKYEIGEILPVVIFLDKENNELERIVGEASSSKLVSTINRYYDE